MKKLMCTILAASLVSLNAAALAAAEAPAVVPPYPSAVLNIDGQSLNYGAQTPYQKDGVMMIPLRLTAEALGFQVTWDGEAQSIFLDNGSVNTTLYIGVDSYYMASSTAIGMSAPAPLGAPPELKNDTTYAPAQLFAVLFCNPEAVRIQDGLITITIPDTNDAPSVQIPNPIQSYPTLEDAKKTLDFSPKLPGSMPAGFQLHGIDVISGSLLQLVYTDGVHTITYRTARLDTDISGDYNHYETTEHRTIHGLDITLKGNGGSFSNASWEQDGVRFSIYTDSGLGEDAMEQIIQSIQ